MQLLRYILPRAGIVLLVALLWWSFYYHPQVRLNRQQHDEGAYIAAVGRQADELRTAINYLKQAQANPPLAHSGQNRVQALALEENAKSLRTVNGPSIAPAFITLSQQYVSSLDDSKQALADSRNLLVHEAATQKALANVLDYDAIKDTANPTVLADNLAAAESGLQAVQESLASVPYYPDNTRHGLADIVSSIQKARDAYGQNTSAGQRQNYVTVVRSAQQALTTNRQGFLATAVPPIVAKLQSEHQQLEAYLRTLQKAY